MKIGSVQIGSLVGLMTLAGCSHDSAVRATDAADGFRALTSRALQVPDVGYILAPVCRATTPLTLPALGFQSNWCYEGRSKVGPRSLFAASSMLGSRPRGACLSAGEEHHEVWDPPLTKLHEKMEIVLSARHLIATGLR